MQPQTRRKWKVYFINGQDRTEYAANQETARILAQAEQIKRGYGYSISHVMEVIER